MIKYMLDTNICIYVIKRKPLEVLSKFNTFAGLLSISTITLSELMHGVEKSERVEHNLKQVEDFVSRLDVFEYGVKASSHYGNIRATLEKQGKTIGVNDLHIAGHARSEGLILVSNNLKEFDRVEALRTENWLEKVKK